MLARRTTETVGLLWTDLLPKLSAPKVLIKRFPTAEIIVWALNIVSLFFVVRYLFRMNSVALFYGWDPQGIRTYFGTRYRLSDAQFGFGSDFINGLGNIAAGYPNPWSYPSVLLSWNASGEIPDPSLTFAIAATELFVATILCGRAFKVPLSVSMAGGWLLTLWTWPLFVFPKIVTVWFFSPTYAEFLSLSIIMVTAGLFIGWGHTWQSIILAAIVLAGITHSLVSNPPFLVLVAPLMITSAMISFLLAHSRAQRLNILLWWITLAAVCLILGYVHYLYGLLAYTSSVVFPASRVRQPDLFGGDITLLLWAPIPLFDSVHIFTPERILVGGGIIGSIVLSLVGSPAQQRFAFSVLTAEGMVLCLGFTNYWWPYWPGPQFVYFEYMLLPYFALCLCFLFFSPLLLAWSALRTRLSPTATGRALGLDRVVALFIPLVQALYAADKGPEVREQAPRYGGYALASQYPQPETPITRILKSEARLTLNEPYRGRVAVVMGRFLGEKDTWLASVLHYYSQLATGQLHDGPGLWQDDIPTLHEYSRSMTPWRWMFTRFFFGVSQWNVDIPKLAAIGVRFIITDLPLSGPKLRAQLSIEAPPSAHALLNPSEGSRFDSFQLYLYEIENVNVGQFSPVEIRRAEDAASILAALSDPLFDFRTSVIGDVPASGSLSKANLESLKMVRDGYKIRASSDAQAVLLMPFEFSHCLYVNSSAATTPPFLFRANFLLTGIFFDRELDAEIKFRTDPIMRSRCRLQDLDDENMMKLRKTRDLLTRLPN